LSIDFRGSLRQLKPERRATRLRPRHPSARISADRLPVGRQALVPDTSVYIHNAAGRLPAAAQAVLDTGIQFHCAVCLGEIAVGIGNADPANRRYPATVAHYAGLIGAIPVTRLLVPDDDTWTKAGVLAGTLARIQGYRPVQRKELLNDALIYLTASKHGLPVLTENHDFDLLWQLHPAGTVIFY